MIDTDLKFLEPEFKEELLFFPDSESLNVRHRFTEKDNKFVNTVTVNGKTYAYGNLVKAASDETEKKRLVKRYAKLSLYKAVSQFTGIKLPWGALTGVRPTKLAYSAIEETGEFREFFTDVMKVSEKKTELTAEVLENQKGIYCKNPDNSDLFVFVPFCPSRCKYCSFITADMKSSASLTDAYTDALCEEIKESAGFIKKLRSIYVGGGTPVALSDRQLEKMLCAIDKINDGAEYTVEAGRPDRITEENLKILKAHGVTRVCVNPQSLSDETLKRIGRNHTAAQAIRALELAKKDFIVNTDLIAGLEGETFATFKATIDKTIELSPDNITVHSLCVKKGAELASEEKNFNPDTEKMIDYAEGALKDAGYGAYYVYRQKYASGNLENAGFTKRGKACVYNVDAMEEISDCVACGANAISKKVDFGGEKIERYGSPKDVKTYLAKKEEILRRKEALFSEKR